MTPIVDVPENDDERLEQAVASTSKKTNDNANDDDEKERERNETEESLEQEQKEKRNRQLKKNGIIGIIVLTIILVVVIVTVVVVNGKPTDEEKVACDFLGIRKIKECLSTKYYFPSTTTGTNIPTEIGVLTQLTSLNLAGVGLTGTIPTEFMDLTRLEFLYLNFNALTGTIPTNAFNTLKNLSSLDLSINALTGTVPSTFSELTSLTYLSLYNNSGLMGTMPSNLCSPKNNVGMNNDVIIDCENIIRCYCCTCN